MIPTQFDPRKDDRAVSPVIGVILMVAITVILAAVIGSFVLNIGGTQETAPQASVSIEESTITESDADTAFSSSDTVTFAHNGGDRFTEDNTNELRVTINGSLLNTEPGDGLEFQAGDTITIEGASDTSDSINVDEDDDVTVRVVWVGEERSSVIAQRTVEAEASA